MLTLLRWACFGCWLVLGCSAIYAPDDQSPPAYCTVFGHFMKCGGSTIKWALETAQPTEQRQPGLCVFSEYSKDLCRNVAMQSGVIEGYSELVRSPLLNAGRLGCSYFTMMRHPVDRLVSQFFYCPTDHDLQRRPPKWCGDVKHPEPLEDRLVQFAEHFWGNHALRMMLFGTTCPPQKGCAPDQAQPSFELNTPEDWERLERAKDLLSTYDAVGIMEHWNMTMALFDARVTSPVRRWQDIVYTVNAGTQSQRRQGLLRWAHQSEKILSIVKGDLVLYQHGLSIFEQQTAEALGAVWTADMA